MTGSLPVHLSADEIDAWLARELPPARRLHLEQCHDCCELVRSQGEIVGQLQQLSRLSPRDDFADRVMALVHIPDPFALRAFGTLRRRIFISRRSFAVAATLALVLLGSMAGSVAWTLANPETLPALGNQLAALAGQWFWLALRGVVSNFIEQPWYDDLRGVLTTPGRLVAAGAVLTLAYLMGVLALRRLLALPTQRVANASL